VPVALCLMITVQEPATGNDFFLLLKLIIVSTRVYQPCENKDFPTNMTKRHLKHSTSFEYADNVRSFNYTVLSDAKTGFVTCLIGSWLTSVCCLQEALKAVYVVCWSANLYCVQIKTGSLYFCNNFIKC